MTSHDRTSVLKCWIDPSVGVGQSRASATLEQLLEDAGWRCKFVSERKHADIRYGLAGTLPGDLPFAGHDAWAAIDVQRAVQHDGVFVPAASIVRTEGCDAIDPVLAGYFFLSGRIEHDAHPHAFAGIPEQASIREWGLETPVIQRLVEMVTSRVPTGPAPRPRWPGKRKWAFCLTHDCDRLLRYRTNGFWRDAGHPGASLRQRAVSTAKALYSGLHFNRGMDPYEASLHAWLDFEREMEMQAVYYVGAWSRADVPSHPHDLVHARTDPETLRLVRACAEQGAEIGLHSGITAWQSGPRYGEEVRRFSASYGIQPKGVRGHYWSVNPNNPEESLSFASRYGALEYDASFGMNVTYGFRRGTSYPYRPFDARTGTYAGLWELPPTVMDGGLHASAPNNAGRMANFASLTDRVRAAGGVLVLDWHSDSLWGGFMENMTAELLPQLQAIIGDSSCWVATGSELIEWCSKTRWKTEDR
ncbi:hypothetical protein BH09GEM1_BH09GEM1_35750 [soil metagenome]